jgi:hypothetical protein
MDKRGQFYLIAAVIISSVIISLVTVKNYAYVEKEPNNFYDLSSQIKDEAARVIDYGVFNSQNQMENFARNLTENLRKTDPGVEIILIFGNETGVNVINFANSSARIGNNEIPGALEDVESFIVLNISDKSYRKESLLDQKLFINNWNVTIGGFNKNVTLSINEQEYIFPLYEYQQFFMIIKKGEKGEEYVEVR